jgi:chemotaxis protein MotB
MARRKDAAHGGGHGWFVTFADLMGLLVSFFVMLVAFSNQDARKMQAVAGSMRDAFGVQKSARYSGILESDGLSTRTKIKNAARIEPPDSSIRPTPQAQVTGLRRSDTFALAAASFRQALQNMPELVEASKHITADETAEGLNLEIVDQDGRSMFPEGDYKPYERMRDLIRALAKPLKNVPYRISITGHTSRTEMLPQPGNGAWQLSSQRAEAVRQILEEEGYRSENIYKIAGKGASDPLFPDDPAAAPNRRVTITLVHEPSPVPPNLLP